MTTVLVEAATERSVVAEVEGGSLAGPSSATLDDAGWTCPLCGLPDVAEAADDDPDLPCWACQQEIHESFRESME